MIRGESYRPVERPLMTIRLILTMMAASAICAHCTAQSSESKTDLFALKLVQSDLQEATRMMTVYDRNDDGAVDQEEQRRLKWKDESKEFDLNRDGKLTHLEFAVREAKRRDDADITQFDVKNVNTFLSRYDKNNNGQLDPDEIVGGWPNNPEDYDSNGDGIITPKEMQIRFAFNRGLRREMGIEGVDQTAAMRLIRHFDQDNDKKLDEAERQGAPLPRPASKFDENDDGKLGIMELATMLAKQRMDLGLTNPDQIKINRLFQQLDRNVDGKISEDESKPYGEAFADTYTQYDGDSDGVITISEVERVVAASRKEKGFIEEDFQQAVTMMRRHDENRSNHIESSELFDTPKAGQLPKAVMGRDDLNRDDRIDLNELAKYFAAQRKRN
jgi:Ca2+-binding EF-hand superfamily protein